MRMNLLIAKPSIQSGGENAGSNAVAYGIDRAVLSVQEK